MACYASSSTDWISYEYPAELSNCSVLCGTALDEGTSPQEEPIEPSGNSGIFVAQGHLKPQTLVPLQGSHPYSPAAEIIRSISIFPTLQSTTGLGMTVGGAYDQSADSTSPLATCRVYTEDSFTTDTLEPATTGCSSASATYLQCYGIRPETSSSR